jgi:hypothetical protein
MKQKWYCIAVFFLSAFMNAATLNAQNNYGLDWVKQIGGTTSYNEASDVAVDAWGNVYTIGRFMFGDSDFNPGADSFILTPNGTYTFFISKLDNAGHFIWAKSFVGGTSAQCSPKGIRIDAKGDIYCVGEFSNTIDFNPGIDTFSLTAQGSLDGFVLKIDSSGAFKWVRQIGGTGEDQANGIAMDNTGHLYVAGSFSSTAYFNQPNNTNATLIATDNRSDAYILKLDTANTFAWVKQLGGIERDYAYSIDVDNAGNVYSIGSFQGNIDLNKGGATPFMLYSYGVNDAFIVKLDATGAFVWGGQIGGPYNDQGMKLTIDDEDNIYLSGEFRGAVDFDISPTAASIMSSVSGSTTGSNPTPNSNLFFAKYNTSGNFIWAKQVKNIRIINDFTTDKKGNVYAIGSFGATGVAYSTTDTFTITSNGDVDAYMLKFNNAGESKWLKSWGGTKGDYGRGMAIDLSQNIYTTGDFAGSVDFDPGPNTTLLSSGNVGFFASDVFIQKLVCADTSSSLLEINAACESYDFNGHHYTESGTYSIILSGENGCDSIVNLVLTIINVEAIINVNGFTLSTTQPYDTYQWLLNNQAITGATQGSYTVPSNGSYRVVVGLASGCTDTSDVYVVNNVTGINDINGIGKQIHVYPNPSNDYIRINSPVAINTVLTSLDGRTVFQNTNTTTIPVKELNNGVYFLRIMDKEGRLIKVERIVKQ